MKSFSSLTGGFKRWGRVTTCGDDETSATSRRHDDRGASLLLALFYVIAISLIVLALASWVTNDLKNTTKFSNAAQYDTALRSVTELGIQNIRYTPLMNVTDASKGEIGYCWTPSSGTMSSQIINGYSVAVWCTTAETLDAANTRVVTLYACPTTVTTGAACASSYGLKATVAFDDYAPGNSAALTSTCVSPACGYSATQEVWSWGNQSGSLVIPSTTTTVVLGVASKLAFTTAPVGAGEGVNFSTNPQVTVEDAGGNQITGDSSNVTIAITGYSGGATGGTTQGTLAGCTKSSESLGVVTFSNCSISGPAAAGTLATTPAAPIGREILAISPATPIGPETPATIPAAPIGPAIIRPIARASAMAASITARASITAAGAITACMRRPIAIRPAGAIGAGR